MSEIEEIVFGTMSCWKANMTLRTFQCSPVLQEILGLESDTVSFDTVKNRIDVAYREEITSSFRGTLDNINYELTFPIYVRQSRVWIHVVSNFKELNELGQWVVYGAISVEEQKSEREVITYSKIERLLQQQSLVSFSLLQLVQAEDPTETINQLLKDILRLFNGERVYIFEYDADKSFQRNTYEVVCEGVLPQKHLLQHLSTEQTPWWNKQMEQKKAIVFSSKSDFPNEMKEDERQILIQQGICSLMVTPLVTGNHTWGYIGIDIVKKHRNWRREDYQWFSSLANIIGLCLELRRARDKAEYESSFLHNLYDHMPLGCVIVKLLYDDNGNPVDYEVVNVNRSAEELMGHELSIGSTGSEMVDKGRCSWLQDVLSVLDQPLEKALFFNETQRYCDCTMYGSGTDEAVILLKDTTDEQRASIAMERSERLFRNIFTNVPIGLELYDPEGKLVDFNSKDMELFGVHDRASVMGVSIFDNPNILDEIKQRIRKEELVEFFLNYHFDQVGAYYNTDREDYINLFTRVSKLYDHEGNLLYYLFVNIDNTEKITALDKVRDFEHFFLLISSYAKVGYAKVNLLTRKGYAVSQWFKNLGEDENTPLSEVVGVYQYLHPEDRQGVLEFISEAIAGRKDNYQAAVRVMSDVPGIEWQWLQMNLMITKYEPESQNIELVGVSYDITDLKQAQIDLIVAKDKAEASDRLKSAFLANMSHEIRTPLSAIVGFSGLLAEAVDDDEKKQYIEIVRYNNELLLQLISDILDLSKIEAGILDFNEGSMDVNQLCHDIVLSLQMKVPAGVELLFDEHLPDCCMISDKVRLQQVITNFVNNAIKFTESGSIKVGYQFKGELIKFYVADTGVGIPAEKQATVFDRFVKLNSFVYGTGLGLSICKSIVERFGGTIGVDSELGKGSCFWFTLPYHGSDAVDSAFDNQSLMKHSVSSPLRADRKFRILIAEDMEANYLLAHAVLKKEYEVKWARDGVEAVEMTREWNPDLILMDVRMPRMDGLQATREIRTFDASLPILCVTAFAYESDKKMAAEAGCSGFITKPIVGNILKSKIEEFLFNDH